MARTKGLSKKENWNWQTAEILRIKQKSKEMQPPRTNQCGFEMLDESWSDSKSEGTTQFEDSAQLEDAILQIDQEQELTRQQAFIPFTQ